MNSSKPALKRPTKPSPFADAIRFMAGRAAEDQRGPRAAARDRNRRRPDAPPSSMPSDKGHDVSVELRSVLAAQPGAGFDGREEDGGQRGVDAFDETDRVAVREEPVAPRVRQLFDKALGAKF